MKLHSPYTFCLAVLLALAGVALLFAGFLAPPHGEIHSSVLIAYGEVSSFAGSVLGFRWYYKSKSDLNSRGDAVKNKQ